jgi:phospholipase/lecithinase/hemolysin
MLRRSLIATAAVLTISAGQALAGSPFSAIYSFGDSLSDVGNVFDATLGFEPASPYVGGQFSNGPIWVQDLAAAFGLPALTPSLSGGTDYAWGGATTGFPATNNPLLPVPHLTDQVKAFTFDHSNVAPSSALYTFSIGANDLFGILSERLPLPAAEALARGAAKVVANEAGVLESAGVLVGEGAKDLVLFDVPDLGVTPEITQHGPVASAVATALSAYFDQQVLLDLAPVEAAGLKVFDLDTFALIDAAVNHPELFGFDNVTDPCWTGATTGFATGGSLCSTVPAVQDQYLFWDHEHPTAAGHLLVADDALHAIGVAVPEASTWAMMILGLAGLAALGARRGREAGAIG